MRLIATPNKDAIQPGERRRENGGGFQFLGVIFSSFIYYSMAIWSRPLAVVSDENTSYFPLRDETFVSVPAIKTTHLRPKRSASGVKTVLPKGIPQ